PVVWMGRYLDRVGRRIAPLSPRLPPPSAASKARCFALGALGWCGGAALVVAAAIGLEHAITTLPAAGQVIAAGLLLKPLLAWRMLRDEVREVEAALSVSLEAGRARLGRLVSRDTSRLDAQAVRESAIESLAENLNDSLVAPVFWFVLLGLPGAALYRWANTADAMWGYRGERNGRDWTWAGKWAARADDALSWIPARITGLLIALVPWPTHSADRARPKPLRHFPWRRWRREARRTPSPNGGWPMAAMALRLGVRLGKPGVYLLNPEGRALPAHGTATAIAIARRVVWATAFGAVGMSAAACWMDLLPCVGWVRGLVSIGEFVNDCCQYISAP
ncbi:MAG: cobalamin biosynthesis protein CobD, partial [Comamonadaceae bacterium]